MLRAALAGLLAAFAATPALAAPAAYDVALVSAFADACVPQRMSYPGTQDTALAAGWQPVERTAHPELDAMMEISEREAADPELKATFEYKIYAQPIEKQDHYLLVSRMSADLGEEGSPDIWTQIGCYLYNFDATGPTDPEPVTALIGNPIANSMDQDGVVAHVWGPPCPMPRTGDTYLTYVSEGSPQAASTGFSGLVLKFSTSEPDPGEVVPETYC